MCVCGNTVNECFLTVHVCVSCVGAFVCAVCVCRPFLCVFIGVCVGVSRVGVSVCCLFMHAYKCGPLSASTMCTVCV